MSPHRRHRGLGLASAALVPLLLLLGAAGLALAGSAGKPRSAAYWDALLADEERVKSVEDEWAAGDEEEELVTEGQLEYQNMERRKARPASRGEFGVDDPGEWATHQEATVGPTMMFAKLNHTTAGGARPRRDGPGRRQAHRQRALLHP